MSTTTFEPRPTWELVDRFPLQGDWSVREYLALDEKRLIEFTDGYLEFLPMPDEVHQWLATYLMFCVQEFLRKRGRGVALPAPFRIQVAENRYREPDVCVLLDDADPRRGRPFWAGADLVVEVVSKDNPEHDYWKKRGEYAAAGIGEYWVVDPQTRQFTIFKLSGGAYIEHGVFTPGQQAASATIDGLAIDVKECFAAGDRATINEQPKRI